MQQSQYSGEEIVHLAQLLTSPNPDSVELAFRIVGEDQALVTALVKPLMLLANFAANYAIQQQADRLLQRQVSPELYQEANGHLKIFHFAQNNQKHYWCMAEYALRTYEEVEEEYERCLSSGNEDLSNQYIQLARYLRRRYKQYELALKYYKKAVLYNPQNSFAQFELASTLHNHFIQNDLRVDEAGVALQAYLCAYELAPQNINCLLNMAILCEDIGDWGLSKHYYQKALQSKPDYIPALNNLANILWQHEEAFEEARELAKQALQLSKGDVHVLDTLGHIEWKGFGDYKRAEDYFLEAIHLNPNHHHSLTGLGDLYAESQRYENAKNYYERGLQFQPQDLKKLEKMLDLLDQRTDEQAETVWYCERILSIDEEHSRARRILEQIQEK